MRPAPRFTGLTQRGAPAPGGDRVETTRSLGPFAMAAHGRAERFDGRSDLGAIRGSQVLEDSVAPFVVRERLPAFLGLDLGGTRVRAVVGEAGSSDDRPVIVGDAARSTPAPPSV